MTLTKTICWRFFCLLQWVSRKLCGTKVWQCCLWVSLFLWGGREHMKTPCRKASRFFLVQIFPTMVASWPHRRLHKRNPRRQEIHEGSPDLQQRKGTLKLWDFFLFSIIRWSPLVWNFGKDCEGLFVIDNNLSLPSLSMILYTLFYHSNLKLWKIKN